MSRVTKENLLRAVAVLNRMVEAPAEPFYRDEDGTFRVNEGTFSIDWAYGGCRLVRNGESIDVSRRGTIRETYIWLHAFTAGIQHAQNLQSEGGKS